MSGATQTVFTADSSHSVYPDAERFADLFVGRAGFKEVTQLFQLV